MFGFFDRKERKRKKALIAFVEKGRKDPLFDRALRSQKKLEIFKRVQVLRNSGNEEKVYAEVMNWLSDDMDRWTSSHDAYDLHYMVETLRLCGLIKDAFLLLGKGKFELAKRYPIDLVWMHLDSGLISPQLGDDPAIALEYFHDAITCEPPEGSRCSRREEARLQAAFCGFVASSANGMEAETQRFLGILRKLSPDKDWTSSQTLEEYGKGFIGFLSSDKQPGPVVTQLPSSELPNHRPREVEGSIASPEEEAQLIHYCIFLRPKRTGGADTDSQDQTLITAQVSAAKTSAEGSHFTIKLNKGHDPLDLVELDSAMFWYERIEKGLVSRDQVVLWMREFDRVAGTSYIKSDGSDFSAAENVVFFGALCSISMLAFIAFLDSVETKHEEATRWFKEQVDQHGRGFRRAWLTSTAKEVRGLMTRGEIDPAFSRLLCKSVGMKVN